MLSALLAAACTEGTPAPAEKKTGGPPRAAWFEDVTAASGLAFRHFAGATGEYAMPEIMGAGGGLLDYDGDGDLDVLLLQGDLLDPRQRIDDALVSPPAGEWRGHRLFRNDLIPAGRLAFTDVTRKAGLSGGGYGMGVAVGDLDNDGDPDLVITH
jgi:hypothetical protein